MSGRSSTVYVVASRPRATPKATLSLWRTVVNGTERPRILCSTCLSRTAREQDVDVRLERGHELGRWSCTLVAKGEGSPVVATGTSAREAIRRALEAAGVVFPEA